MYVFACLCMGNALCLYICLVMCSFIICIGPFDYSLLLLECVSSKSVCWKLNHHCSHTKSEASLKCFLCRALMNGWVAALSRGLPYLPPWDNAEDLQRILKPLQTWDPMHFWALQLTPSVEFCCSRAKQIKTPPQPRCRAVKPWRPWSCRHQYHFGISEWQSWAASQRSNFWRLLAFPLTEVPPFPL